MNHSLQPVYDQTTETDRMIRMAWEDRTTFEEIEEAYGVSEADVIRIMRRELKPKSFRLWRKRVSGRVTKHRTRFRAERKRLRVADGMED
jgi:uncharacterized protein (TIGR03643 family)